MPDEIRLTEYAKGGGCAAKLRLGDLVEVMKGFTPLPVEDYDDRVMVGTEFRDDAAVVRMPGDQERGLAMTTDIIGPLVDDPATFGAIAATNAISDIYAMGGVPLYALNLVFFPDDRLPLSVLGAIMSGAADKSREVGVPIVGGHSVCNDHVKYGLAVVGQVPLDQVLSNRGARPGQKLVLSKALGTGVIASSIRTGDADPAAAQAAIDSMCLMNRVALEVGRAHGVSACTDVTGFGLFGHLRNLLSGSELTARVDVASLPLLPGALELALADRFPAGSRANLEFVEPNLRRVGLPAGPEAKARVCLAADAQTSGGLLMCIDADRADAAVEALSQSGHAAAIVGDLAEASASVPTGTIEVGWG